MAHELSSTQNRDVYSKREAARRLGVSYTSLHAHLIKSGLVRTVRVGRRVLIPRGEIERFLKAKK